MSKKLKLIGLTLVALCAFGAVSAGGAQAANWTVGTENPLVGSKNVAEVVTLLPRVSGESPASTELTVPSLGITLNSKGVMIINGKITGPSGGSADEIDFTNVTVTGAGGCVVKDKLAGAVAGTVRTNPQNVQLVTVAGKTYFLFTPVTSPFVTILIEKAAGKTCSVSGEYEVKGTAALQVATETMNTTLESESNETIQKASGKELAFGAKPAYLDIKGTISLNPAVAWGVKP